MRDLSSFDLFDAAYGSMVKRVLTTEEEGKALDALDKKISDASFESDTGMPAITQWMPPANADALPPNTIGPDVGGADG